MTRLLLLCALALAAFGCGRNQPPSATVPGVASQADTAASTQVTDSSPPADPNPATPPSASPPDPARAAIAPVRPVAIPSGDSAAVLASLTQGLRRYGVEKQRVPASLSEVIAAGYIPVMPQAPSGKKFILDAKRMEVVLANQ